jgi:hypothetical protein
MTAARRLAAILPADIVGYSRATPLGQPQERHCLRAVTCTAWRDGAALGKPSPSASLHSRSRLEVHKSRLVLGGLFATEPFFIELSLHPSH